MKIYGHITLTPELRDHLIEQRMLLPNGEVPADILAALAAGFEKENIPYHGIVLEHLWLDKGGNDWVWRLDDFPIYVVRLPDGTLEKGSATY